MCCQHKGSPWMLLLLLLCIWAATILLLSTRLRTMSTHDAPCAEGGHLAAGVAIKHSKQRSVVVIHAEVDGMRVFHVGAPALTRRATPPEPIVPACPGVLLADSRGKCTVGNCCVSYGVDGACGAPQCVQGRCGTSPS